MKEPIRVTALIPEEDHVMQTRFLRSALRALHGFFVPAGISLAQSPGPALNPTSISRPSPPLPSRSSTFQSSYLR
jgi:hypothetical protein